MKQIHHIWLTVYCKPEDKEEFVIENLRKFLPFDLEKQKIKLERKNATSVDERQIIIFQVHIDKQRHIKEFIENLNQILNDEQKELLLRQKKSRLDESNHFFIRFDKEKLIDKNEFFITDKGNCFHIKMSIAAFPTTRGIAFKVLEKIFSNIKKA